MKNLIKTICFATLLAGFNSYAESSTSTLLMTESNGSYNIDFLNESNVTAMQFDIEAKSGFTQNSLQSCTASLPKTHTGSCVIQKNGDLRVLIYSDNNLSLESGTLGNFKLDSKVFEGAKIVNTLMSTAQGKEVKSEVVLDLGVDNRPLRNKSIK